MASSHGPTLIIDEGLGIADGKPSRELLRAATDRQADLVVLGVDGCSATDRLFFGSTTQHVVRLATCPVLTLRAT